MKFRRIISHPYTLMTSFFFIVVGAKPIGGIYFLYLILGLSYGAVYSILDIGGIAVILFSHFQYKRLVQSIDDCVINLADDILLILSLLLFFYFEAERFNVSLHGQVFSLLNLIVFGVL